MNIITVFFTVKPENRTAMIRLCKSMINPSRSEQGCISYNFYQDLSDENKFFFFEEWENQKAIDAHVRTSHYVEFVPQFESMISEPSNLQIRTVH